MIRADGVWDFALFGSRMSCENLVRVMNGLEDDEDCPDEEIVDLLGELVNMVSGSVKKEMGSGEAKSSTTIPFFLEGEEFSKSKLVKFLSWADALVPKSSRVKFISSSRSETRQD